MAGTFRGDKLLVSVSNGRSYAPCSYLYRVVDERVHLACVSQVADMSGDREHDESVLLDDVDSFVPARHLRSLADGYDVEFFLDGWEACAYYGYDCGDTVGLRWPEIVRESV